MSMSSFENNSASMGDLTEENQALAHLRDLRRKASVALKRHRHTLEKQLKEKDDASLWPWYRQIADSILAEPDNFPRGTSECIVKNSHSGADEIVRLNVKLSAFENAQLLYKKAKKGERGHEMADAKVSRTTKAIEELSGFIARIDGHPSDRGTDEEFLADIGKRARDLDLVPKTDMLARKPIAVKPSVPYRHFEIDGYDVYAGKTDMQNDELTTRFAKPWDIWMHVAAHAGSHVVIRREKNSEWPPRLVIEKAASISIWFSKARYTSYAEVHVTEARFVRKPRHSEPGKVIAERCKTVRVAPKSPRDIFEKKDFFAVESTEDTGWE